MQQKRKEITALYFQTKQLMLECEELDSRFRTFVQPPMELVKAFDHLMRSEAIKRGMLEEHPNGEKITETVQYSDSQEKAAYSHVLRAFFDTADWYSIEIRKQIIDTMSPYSVECIRTVFPEYYTEIKAEINRINQAIAAVRGKKDVGNMPSDEIENYIGLLARLRKYAMAVTDKQAALEDATARLKKERSIWRVEHYCMAAITAVIGAVIGWLIKGL